ncbi:MULTISPECIES: hypothetical protein [unclassified Moorena]|uniref:hypothetical protein n=1 Tax=unclassified Moorena TaxID=2683338 RepID=UPI0013FFC908|nr:MULTISPECIES: hypothetical protein [unclassified Moorena]NEO16141.1 hypothetical protein [Moorena sp. SIO3E8]NEQ02671.1 hypothetical protein [Moorena sp. SIO3F7]
MKTFVTNFFGNRESGVGSREWEQILCTSLVIRIAIGSGINTKGNREGVVEWGKILCFQVLIN